MISYRPLKDLLYNNDIKIKELVENKVLTPTNSVYVNNDSGHLSIKTIDRVIEYLSNRLDRDILVSDIIVYVID